MDIKDFARLLLQKKQTIFSIVFLVLAISMVLTFVQPFKYSTEARIILVQGFKEGTDPYTMAKSNEFLSNVLSNVILSNSFFDDVMDSGFNISREYFPADAKQRIDKWRETVEARPLSDTGIIYITVYHADKYQSEQIVRAIDYVLQNKHQEYYSGDKNLEVKIIDRPIVSDFPVKPNIVLNAGLALVLGTVISFCYVYLFPDRGYDIVLFPRRRRITRGLAKMESVMVKGEVELNNAPIKKDPKYNQRNRKMEKKLTRMENVVELQGNMRNIF